MSKTKVHVVCQLDATQGDSEKRSKPYKNTVTRASQLINTVMRRQDTRSSSPGQLAGVSDG